MKQKQTDLIVLGLAGLAVYMIMKGNKTTARTNGGAGQTLADMTKEIFDSAGQAFANGWRYFTDGTAIDPYGNYYKAGQMIYTNPNMFP